MIGGASSGWMGKPADFYRNSAEPRPIRSGVAKSWRLVRRRARDGRLGAATAFQAVADQRRIRSGYPQLSVECSRGYFQGALGFGFGCATKRG